MMATPRTSPSIRFVALDLAILFLQIFTVQLAVSSQVDNDILRKWKPLAVDEALLVKKGFGGDDRVYGEVTKPSDRVPEPIEVTPLFGDKTYTTKTVNLMDEMRAMDERDRSRRANKLMSLPEVPTKELTRLIVNRGKDVPTFALSEINQPVDMREGRRDKNGNEIIASYNLMIPIFVPGVRPKGSLTTLRPGPVKYVKETVTEMVPVSKTVPHVKEVLKAEKVPQEVLTHYVAARGRTVPPRITDAILPGERVVTSTVTLLD